MYMLFPAFSDHTVHGLKKDLHLVFLVSVIILQPVATRQRTGGQEGKDVKGGKQNCR